jgi:hypothetical protein
VLRPADVQLLVDRVRYKPHFKISVRYEGPEYSPRDVTVNLTLTAPDANTVVGDKDELLPPLIAVTLPFMVTYEALFHMDASDFYELLHENIKRLEFHEVDEWLRVDGRRLHDPHAHPAEVELKRVIQATLDQVWPHK